MDMKVVLKPVDSVNPEWPKEIPVCTPFLCEIPDDGIKVAIVVSYASGMCLFFGGDCITYGTVEYLRNQRFIRILGKDESFEVFGVGSKMSHEPATCTINGVELVAAPPPRPGLCFGCYLYESLLNPRACSEAKPEGYVNPPQHGYCTDKRVVWVRKPESETSSHMGTQPKE